MSQWATELDFDTFIVWPTPGLSEVRSAEQIPYTRSAEQFIDWSPGPEADRLTTELSLAG